MKCIHIYLGRVHYLGEIGKVIIFFVDELSDQYYYYLLYIMLYYLVSSNGYIRMYKKIAFRIPIKFILIYNTFIKTTKTV